MSIRLFYFTIIFFPSTMYIPLSRRISLLPCTMPRKAERPAMSLMVTMRSSGVTMRMPPSVAKTSTLRRLSVLMLPMAVEGGRVALCPSF